MNISTCKDNKNNIFIEARKTRENNIERARIIEESALDVLPFDSSVLPNCLGGYIDEIANKYHINNACLALSALSLVGSFSGYKYYIIDDKLGYCENKLYSKTGVIIVGKSGTGKTPLFESLTAPIQQIENKGKRLYCQRLQKAQELQRKAQQAKNELYRIDRQNKRNRNALTLEEVEAQEKHIRELEALTALEFTDEAQEPNAPALYLVKPKSAEGVKRVLLNNLQNEHRNGVIVATSEASNIFNINGGIDRALERFTQYSEILDGDDFNEITITTRGAGEYYQEGKKFAGFLTAIQPEPLSKFLKYDSLQGQGFLNRFIKIYLNPTNEAPTITPISKDKKQDYFNIFEALDRSKGGAFSLSNKAIDIYQGWRVKNRQRRKNEQEQGNENEASFLSKIESIALCFAQSIALCRLVENEQLDEGRYIINDEDIKSALYVTEKAIEYTFNCNTLLYRSLERGEQNTLSKLTQLEENTLEVIKEQGQDGATKTTLKDKINKFRGGKRSKGETLLNDVLKTLLERGEIAQNGKRYYIVDLEEVEDEENEIEDNKEQELEDYTNEAIKQWNSLVISNKKTSNKLLYRLNVNEDLKNKMRIIKEQYTIEDLKDAFIVAFVDDFNWTFETVLKYNNIQLLLGKEEQNKGYYKTLYYQQLRTKE